jgi:hypothetical protein
LQNYVEIQAYKQKTPELLVPMRSPETNLKFIYFFLWNLDITSEATQWSASEPIIRSNSPSIKRVSPNSFKQLTNYIITPKVTEPFHEILDDELLVSILTISTNESNSHIVSSDNSVIFVLENEQNDNSL